MKRETIIALAIAAVVFLLLFKGASHFARDGDGSGRSAVDKGNVIVYGSKSCGWTVRQEEYLKKWGIPYTFVDCNKESCPDFVNGFPTLMVNNQVKVGYTEV
jgi:glutaredoxin